MVKRQDQKKKKEGNLASGSAKIIGGTYLGVQGVRSGIPRALGVRLETHSTTHKKAKEILKTGYLDPNRSGEGAVDLLREIDPEKYQKAKAKVYVTGAHPDTSQAQQAQGLAMRKMQRIGYRAQAGREKEIADLRKKYGFVEGTQRAQVALANDIEKAKLGIKGRSLYIGGSDEYFRKNFSPDFDDLNAMYSDKKVRVYGNRARATYEAVRREGLKNLLIKGNKKRIGAGLALLGVAGAGGALAYSGIKDVRSYIRNGKTVKGYKRKNNAKKKR